MTKKNDKVFLFETRLHWLAEDRGIMHAHAANGPLYTSSPAEFGGSGKEWSPEHLLLSAIDSCYMLTFVGFAKKANLSFTHLECNAIGQVQLVDGKYKFSIINVYPKIQISNEAFRELANATALKTQRYCLVSNSINAEIIYHTEIVHEKQFPEMRKSASLY